MDKEAYRKAFGGMGRVKTSYTLLYNWDHSDEDGICGMGKESGTVTGEVELWEFLYQLSYNSAIKHRDGYPYNYVVDISIEPVSEGIG